MPAGSHSYQMYTLLLIFKKLRQSTISTLMKFLICASFHGQRGSSLVIFHSESRHNIKSSEVYIYNNTHFFSYHNINHIFCTNKYLHIKNVYIDIPDSTSCFNCCCYFHHRNIYYITVYETCRLNWRTRVL